MKWMSKEKSQVLNSSRQLFMCITFTGDFTSLYWMLKTIHAAPSNLQSCCPVEQVGKVKILDVVSSDDVRVHCPQKLCPALLRHMNRQQWQNRWSANASKIMKTCNMYSKIMSAILALQFLWASHPTGINKVKSRSKSYTSVYTCSSRFSCVKHNICEPTMLAQDWRVNTVRIKGSVSPCRCTIDAIWITGSLSASGKIPGKRRNIRVISILLLIIITVLLFINCVPCHINAERERNTHLFFLHTLYQS